MSVETESAPRQTLEVGRIYQGDCLDVMRQIESGTVDLAFADPPFNIGYEYDAYHDQQDPEEYVAWSRAWIEEVYRVLTPGGTFWLAIGDEYAAELKLAAEHQVGFMARSWVVWYYTFGVNCTRKFSRSHAHLLHFVKDEENFTFNADDPQVRVPSARALVYADKRANPAGRLPDDTWILRPQDLQEGFQPTDDTWYYARVAGTFKERQGFHGCQMPEQLLGRIIRASSNPGDVVLDPFAGSGTTLAVAKKLGRQWVGCELSGEYVRAATDRIAAVHEGDALNGPADPIASAPSTANGKRLERAEAINDMVCLVDSVSAGREFAADAAVRSRPAQLVRDMIRDAIVAAFYATHDGYSIDWLLAEPRLQGAFHDACREAGLIGGPTDWNRELLRLRKAGRFPKRGQIRKVHVSDGEMDAYAFAAEIAWRLAGDKFGSPSLDEIFCDSEKVACFDRVAKRYAPDFAPAQYRWAALRFRKASRELVDEVKKYHFVFASRDFGRLQSWRRFNPDRYTDQPGIYLLRDAAKAPLYIGRTLDLGRRFMQHLECRAIGGRVAQVAVIAGDDQPGDAYRGALKEDLVRRYVPMWNVNLVGLHAATGS